MSNYFFNFSKTNFAPNVVNSPPYNNTLPSSECSNGFPIDKYSGYGVNAWEVLYSIWCSSQNTLGAKFSYNQCVTKAPGLNPVCSGPANIFIIRHGEKNQKKPNYCLDNNGAYRASQIMTFINQLANDGYPISYIVSCNPCPYNTDDPSMRPMQTASAASFMLNIPMFIYGGSLDYTSIVNGIFSSGQYDGLNVLIVWEHGAIQQLCLNILDTAGSINRLPNNMTTGDEFFNTFNPCANGNYICNDSLSHFYPPDPNTVQGVGTNTEKYPYWNNYNFDNVYWLSSISPNYTFGFSIFKEPCYTCYPSCGINIGLYQPLNPSCESSNIYYKSTDEVENKCQVPSEWQV